jgi:uncharacterized membrane protein
MSGPLLSTAVPLALGASVCWALANVFVARGTRLVGTFRGLLWAQVAGGLLAAALALALARRSPAAGFSITTLAWLAGAGVAALLAYLCMFYALERGRLSIAVAIMSGWAVISTAISVLLFREAAHPPQLAGAALVVAGVILVSRHARDAPVGAAGAGRGCASAALGAGLDGRGARLRRADPRDRPHQRGDGADSLQRRRVRGRHPAGAATGGLAAR